MNRWLKNIICLCVVFLAFGREYASSSPPQDSFNITANISLAASLKINLDDNSTPQFPYKKTEEVSSEKGNEEKEDDHKLLAKIFPIAYAYLYFLFNFNTSYNHLSSLNHNLAVALTPFYQLYHSYIL